ncbi:PREDICTED: multidrug resistance-associated protein 4-like isoform X1 [Branchiostoma belcheri]|uniref:Multidrug resistance-associated protein 4 n=1 Tax=Branchiostoma belcheri TaxID=7741 RepID=A0A6P5AX34_BRABE|nr:PREDICTED: multidrug resistance-associated protein 4-like isoform X1 [Branchiostoma belcheri]
MDGSVKIIKPNPIEKANVFSKLFFWWLNPLFYTGYKRRLEERDMYNVKYEDSSQKQCDDLEREWNKELQKRGRSQKPSLLRAVLRCYAPGWSLLGIIAFIEEATKVVSPVLLGKLVDYFSPDTQISLGEAYGYAAGISACAMALAVLHHPYFYGVSVYGWRLRVACCSLIHKKALKLSNKAMTETTTGQIVNLLSNDVNRFDQVPMFLHYLWIAPAQVATVVSLLWLDLGLSALVGVVGFVLLLLPVQTLLGRLFSKIRAETAKRTDNRVRTMNEIISAIRVIKMYTWEKPFSKLIAQYRKLEVDKVLQASYCQSFNNGFFFCASKVILFFTFMSYVLLGNTIVASKVFVAITLFNAIRLTVSLFIPFAVQKGSEGLISIKRIQTFLLLDEVEPSTTPDPAVQTRPEDCHVTVTGVTASWDESLEPPTLRNIEFEVKPGELVAVIGPVGAGKSSILSAILRELPVTSGEVRVEGRLAYASQVPWIFSGSVQQNILFGKEMEREKYQRVIKACALQKDLSLFSHGDQTLVGDRGIMLSGGQKARINLARAVYHDADIYLLDDPLSAVDAEVGKHLFDRCIQGTLKDKPRILVTHQLQYLQSANKILILKEGEQLMLGTYQELVQSGVDFTELLKTDDEEEEPGEEHGILEIDGGLRHRSRTMSSGAKDGRVLSLDKIKLEEKAPEQEEEDRREGVVGWSVYRDYFTAGTGLGGIILAMFLNIAAQGLFIVTDWWMAYWAQEEEDYYRATHPATTLPSNGVNTTLPYNMTIPRVDTNRNIYVLAGTTAALVVFSVFRSAWMFAMCIKSSQVLHDRMFSRVVRAPVLFFDSNPVGRILNRFSKDLGHLDDLLPSIILDFVTITMQVLGGVILAGVINPWVFIPVVPVVLLLVVIRRYYMRTSRDIKRLEATTRSPVFSHLSATLQGLWTIRAFGAQENFQQEFHAHQDLHSEAWFLFLAASRWFGIRMDWLAAIFIIAVAFCSVLAAQSLDSGLVGLSLSYALILMGGFQWGVRQSTECETLMTSAERIIEYSKLDQEPPLENDYSLPPNWPVHGIITFEGVSFCYSPDGPKVLKNLYGCIRAKEKVGIVGRTGAGKSSLMQMLFRMAEPRGLVMIDGIDITKIGVHDLRRRISVIPQDPVLFSGTLRNNLDPFREFTDNQLWGALEEVQLKTVVEELPGKLESELAESGTNFSVGQRQLVCLARALLRKNRILIIDEATANVDPRTDQLIQQTIRHKFRHCTVLTIAHRLNTIIDMDRIMVIDEGRIKEFDEAHDLLQREGGLFGKMLDQVGGRAAAELRERAENLYKLRHRNDEIWDQIKDSQRIHLANYLPSSGYTHIQIETNV